MKIVYVYADSPSEWNSSEWRCAVPVRAINRTGRHSAQLLNIEDFAYHTPAAQDACNPAEVIVVQRNLFGPVLSAIQHWKARDKTILADFDDAFHLIHPSNPNYELWNQGIQRKDGAPAKQIDPLPLTQFKWGLRLVHGATVPSKRLVDDWQAFTEMAYLPNYIDMSRYRNTRSEPHEGIILGWGGSLSHLQSFSGSGIGQALKRVCKARPQVKVLICGSDVRVLDLLPLPSAQKIYQPFVPYDEWEQVLAKFDIGLAPLHGSFDERRSWIKVLEYMVMKIPWVASEGPAYQDLRPYGWLVQNTSNAWERVLLDMVDQFEDYRQEAAGAAYLYGISQSIDENVDQLISTYTKVQAQAGWGYQSVQPDLGFTSTLS